MWKVKDKVYTGERTVQELRRKDENNRELEYLGHCGLDRW
jgi:hypothetical protein